MIPMPGLVDLPTDADLHQTLLRNELSTLASKLRSTYPFNDKDILETARNLKNINHNLLK